MKIIVQDTDATIRELLTVCLHIEGINVLAVKYSHDVVNYVEYFKPDQVIIDLKNPKGAVDTCRAVKSKYPQLPVIALSCNKRIMEKYQQLSFDDYITKPFKLNTLLSTLAKHDKSSQTALKLSF